MTNALNLYCSEHITNCKRSLWGSDTN